MPERNYPPAYLRYLKARLSNFLRPSFWGTGIFLLVVGLVIWQSWFNPEFLTQNENKETAKEVVAPTTTEETAEETIEENTEKTALSEEDKAIAADIDNMPNLLSDFAKATISVPIKTYSPSKNQANNSNKFLDSANQGQANTRLMTVNQVPQVSVKNPFLEQAQTLLYSHSSYSRNQILGINNSATLPETTETTTTANLGIGYNYQTINNQNTIVVSPLETAIKNSSNTNQINSVGSNTGVRTMYTPNSLPSSSGVGYIQPTVTNVQSNYYGNVNGVQTTPNTGITTNVVDGIPNNPYPNNPYSVQSPSQGVVNSTTPIGYGNYGNNTLQQPGQLPQSNLSYPGQVQQGNNRRIINISGN